MHTEHITFKKRQLASLRDVETIDEERAKNIARLESEIRALEGNPDEPNQKELLELRAALAAAQASIADLVKRHKAELAALTAKATKPANKK